MSRRHCNATTVMNRRCRNVATTGELCTLHFNRNIRNTDSILDDEIIRLLNTISLPPDTLGELYRIPLGFGQINTRRRKSDLDKILESQNKSPRLDETECAICLETPIDRINTACCKKPFCKKCIKKSLGIKPECPACRTSKAGFNY